MAVDFGTTYSGYSFVLKKDKERIHYMRKNKGMRIVKSWFCFFHFKHLDLENYNKIPYVMKQIFIETKHAIG